MKKGYFVSNPSIYPKEVKLKEKKKENKMKESISPETMEAVRALVVIMACEKGGNEELLRRVEARLEQERTRGKKKKEQS